MKLTRKGWIPSADARDARVEAIEELVAGLRRVPKKLRLVRNILARQFSPEGDPAVRPPVIPVRRTA